MIEGPLKTLVDAAVLAPSGDNLQPWKFQVDSPKSTISILVDETRDTSPLNAGQRMSRVACGASIENIIQTANHNGWQSEVDLRNDGLRVARIHVASPGLPSGSIPDPVVKRHTNRKCYDGRSLSEPEKQSIAQAVPAEKDIKVIWYTEREQINEWSKTIGNADAQMFAAPEFLRAFLANVRFDLSANACADEGLPTGSLEMSSFERRLLPLLKFAPGFVLKSRLLQNSFRTHSRKLVNSSSGICCLVSSSTDQQVSVGMMMQRGWLALTDAGYQVQPMMSIPVLLNANRFDSASLPECAQGQPPPVAILRFGHGSIATTRTGRTRQLPLVDVPLTPSMRETNAPI